ncbi:hypothetical protein HGRIS_003374 [Hohenbuehelia grisea]|uniref:Uncharacterized protein n=1 Tax=Hohenbuehelia grisea TaxID=104357 RepID=A0ABR3JG11_9AGAR
MAENPITTHTFNFPDDPFFVAPSADLNGNNDINDDHQEDAPEPLGDSYSRATTTDPDFDDLDDTIDPTLGGSDLPNPSTQRHTSTTNLSALARSIKRHKKLLPEAESKLDSFCHAIASELKTNILVYTKSFLLSPTLSSYRGKITEQVLEAMRKYNVADIRKTPGAPKMLKAC